MYVGLMFCGVFVRFVRGKFLYVEDLGGGVFWLRGY